jgi:hypothetical protein
MRKRSGTVGSYQPQFNHGCYSNVEVNIYTTILAALVLYFSDTHSTDLSGFVHVSAAAGLQVDAGDVQ